MTADRLTMPDNRGACECAYNLFRHKCLPDIICAVPEDRPVPGFIDSERWSFEQSLRALDTCPPGFDSGAARTGARFNGFHLFYAFAATPGVRSALEMMGGL